MDDEENFICNRTLSWPIITGDALRAYNQIKELSKDNLVDVFSVERANSSSGGVNSFINLSDSGGLSKLDKIKI